MPVVASLAAAAKKFALEGAQVVVNDLDVQQATAVVAEFQEKGGTGIAVAGDVTATTSLIS